MAEDTKRQLEQPQQPQKVVPEGDGVGGSKNQLDLGKEYTGINTVDLKVSFNLKNIELMSRASNAGGLGITVTSRKNAPQTKMGLINVGNC